MGAFRSQSWIRDARRLFAPVTGAPEFIWKSLVGHVCLKSPRCFVFLQFDFEKSACQGLYFLLINFFNHLMGWYYWFWICFLLPINRLLWVSFAWSWDPQSCLCLAATWTIIFIDFHSSSFCTSEFHKEDHLQKHSAQMNLWKASWKGFGNC